MGAPRIKRIKSAEHKRALSMLKLGKVATITLVVDNDGIGQRAVIAAGLTYESVASYLTETVASDHPGRNLELMDVVLTV